MDLKDDENYLKFREYPHYTSRYFESNAGHLFVNNVNPFNTVGGHAGDVKENLMNRRKTEEFIDIFNNMPNKELNATPSRELVCDILNNYPFNENVFMNKQYDEINEELMAGTHRPFPQPMVSMSAKLFDTEYTSCSRDASETPRYERKTRYNEYRQDNNRHRTFSTDEMVSDPTVDGNGRCEKTTYCRPLLNMFNQEFIYKTMHRNAKLQKLVRKLLIAREREKRREAWNNYINDLKNKHMYYSNEPSRISPQYVPGDHTSPEMIDDFYNTRFNWRQSDPCQHLLEDVYGAHNYMPSNAYSRYPHDYDSSIPPDVGSFIYENNRFCYPTSSQACIQRWNRYRQENGYGYDWRTRPSGRYFRGNTIVIEKEHKGFFDRIQGTNRPYPPIPPHKPKSRILSVHIQTESKLPLVEEERKTKEEDDKELNVLKVESVQDDKDIYFPYGKEAVTSDKSTPESLNQETEQYQDGKVLHKQESLENHMDVNVPHIQKDDKQDKNVNISPKQESLKTNEDINISKKLEAFKNKMAEKVLTKQKSYKHEDIDDLQKHESFKDKFKRVTDNITRLKDKIRESEEETKLKTLATIEEKIDVLMKSINSIMIDIKTKKNILLSRKTAAVSCTFVTTSRNHLNRHRSDPYGLVRNGEYLCSMVQSSSKSLNISEVGPSELRKHRESSISKLDKIILEEMKKSAIVKKDIEELLNLRNEKNCSVQITFDIPTKERSTEVTDSLSKARLESGSKALVEEIASQGPPNHTQMTIAVNTDPLGLLALLRVSTETVKQLFSYVPYLNYYSYLSMLQLPPRSCVSHYVCNICGAAFGRPSQLSDHIEQHNLGRTRDCCVCRHALDLPRARPGVFACRHCGQRFTRAYCCELHQQACATRLGRAHDVNSGHMLLR